MLPNLKQVWKQLDEEELKVPPLPEDSGIKSEIIKLWKLALLYLKKTPARAAISFNKILDEDFVMFKIERPQVDETTLLLLQSQIKQEPDTAIEEPDPLLLDVKPDVSNIKIEIEPEQFGPLFAPQ